MFTTPLEGYMEISNERAALYVHLLFALKDHNLGQFEANFVSLIYHAFRFLQVHWRTMSDDIRHGKVNSAFEMASTTRKSLERSLQGPDPARADWIDREFALGVEGIATRLWPNLRCILSCNTGPFQLYDEKLSTFIPKSVPRYSPLYAASEGLLGINLEENGSNYIMPPRAMFLEFIPVLSDDEGEPEKVLFADQIEIGGVYELVITNMSGLIRYRMGDVLKLVGRYHNAPIIEFQYRKVSLLFLIADMLIIIRVN